MSTHQHDLASRNDARFHNVTMMAMRKRGVRKEDFAANSLVRRPTPGRGGCSGTSIDTGCSCRRETGSRESRSGPTLQNKHDIKCMIDALIRSVRGKWQTSTVCVEVGQRVDVLRRCRNQAPAIKHWTCIISCASIGAWQKNMVPKYV